MKRSRNTVAKSAVLELISRSDVALSHSEIQTSVVGVCDRVTVYRVLDRLAEEGKIHKVVNTDGVIKYAGCQKCETIHRHDHVHFSCEKCRTVTCLEDIEPSFDLPGEYVVRGVNFLVSGICPLCSGISVRG